MFKAPSYKDELPRDRWGRPLITPPDGGEPIAYTRVTTFAKALEDTYHLSKWQQRMVALGLPKRQDLILAASAITDPDDASQKRTLNEIAEAAMEAAQPSAARIGTAIHSFTERVDRGEDLSGIPATALPDLMAYKSVKDSAGLDVHSLETFVVVDDLKVGGTYDRMYVLTKSLQLPDKIAQRLIARYGVHSLPNEVTADGGRYWVKAGTHVIGDIKTGKSVELGAGSFAIQLGAYASGETYNHTTGSRSPLPQPLSRALAIIAHVPAGKGASQLHWLDIGGGIAAIELARSVREYRSDSPSMIRPFVSGDLDDVSVAEAIRSASSYDELKAIYRRNKAHWTPGLTNLVNDVLAALAATR